MSAELTPEEWETVKDLVFACHQLQRDAQRPWLHEHCPPGRVRTEVERLLDGSQISSSFMSRSAPQQLLAEPRGIPERIGRFRIEQQLGAGGMGVVYSAVDEKLGRHVALKVLQGDVTIDEERRKRLVWDARAASALNHPNIVTVYETGEADGVDYVAMELVPGRTLAQALDSEPWPQTRVLSIAIQVAAALESAHAQGIVHRDLKPSNVIITPAGVAKLVDFGLAKNMGGMLTENAAPTTIQGRLAGTVAYMSPEQAEGAEVDFRSDIFSYGSLVYEMLTRQRAFAGVSTVSILAKIIHTEPITPASMTAALDPRLQDIVNRCLRKDRARRFQSMGEVRVRLQEIVDDPTPAPVRPVAPAASPFWRYAAIAASLVAAAAIVVAIVFRPRPPADAPPALTRLTWDGGLTTHPSISRDGTFLAYASDRAGRGDLDIYMQRMGGADPIRLTDDPADESSPVVSPDGTKVAYRSERGGGGVYVVPSTGGSQRLLVPGCRDPEYSPDGQRLACWTGDTGGAFYPGAAAIKIVPTGGGPSHAFRPDFEAAAFPLWMPDGSGILFLGRKPDAKGNPIIDWWIAGEQGAERATGARKHLPLDPALKHSLPRDHKLEPLMGTYFIRPEAWLAGAVDAAPSILFTARREDATNVWRLPLNAGGEVAGPPRPATHSAGVDERPTSPGGLAEPSIVFANLSVDYQLRRIPLVGRRAGAALEHLLPMVSQIGSPSASADGSVLVFSARQPNGYRVIAVDTATADQHSVTTVESPDFVRVLVSGDGKTVVYGGANDTSYRMTISPQGQPERICAGCGWPTHVNADGTEALFESLGADERLLIWSGKEVRPLIAGADPKNRMQYAGRFSPDKRLVAFCAGARGVTARQIVIVPNAPGRELAPEEWVSISEDPRTTDREPTWSADGRRLYFISDRDGFRCIWARDVDPRNGRPVAPAVPIAHFHHARELLRAPVPQTGAIGLTATIDSLIFTVAESTGNLWWQRGATR